MISDILHVITVNKIYGFNFIRFLFLFLLLLLVYFVCQLCLIGVIKLLLALLNNISFFKAILTEITKTMEKQTFPFSLLRSKIFFILLSVPLVSYCYFLLPISTLPLRIKEILIFSTSLTWLFTFLTFAISLPFERSSKISFHSSILTSLIISIVIYYNFNLIIN